MTKLLRNDVELSKIIIAPSSALATPETRSRNWKSRCRRLKYSSFIHSLSKAAFFLFQFGLFAMMVIESQHPPPISIFVQNNHGRSSKIQKRCGEQHLKPIWPWNWNDFIRFTFTDWDKSRTVNLLYWYCRGCGRNRNIWRDLHALHGCRLRRAVFSLRT